MYCTVLCTYLKSLGKVLKDRHPHTTPIRCAQRVFYKNMIFPKKR